MLPRVIVSGLLLFSLGASQARAADPVTIGVGAAVAVGAATVTLKLCKNFLQSIREPWMDEFPAPAVASPVVQDPKGMLKIRIDALALADREVALKLIEKDGELFVVPEFQQGKHLPERLKLALDTGANYFVSFQDIFLSNRTAAAFVDELEAGMRNQGFSANLELHLTTSPESEFVITVSGVRSAEEWIDAHLHVLHAVGGRYFYEGHP